MDLDPAVQDFGEELVKGLDLIQSSLSEIITVRSWLAGTAHGLNVPLDPDVRADLEKRLVELSQAACKPVQERLDEFSRFATLLPGGDMARQVDDFVLGEPRDFKATRALIEGLREQRTVLQDMDDHVRTPRAMVDSSSLRTSLTRLCDEHITRLLTRLAEQHNEESAAICRAFMVISKQAVAEPEDSKEMFELIAYMDKVR
jgi:dynein heavy chain